MERYTRDNVRGGKKENLGNEKYRIKNFQRFAPPLRLGNFRIARGPDEAGAVEGAAPIVNRVPPPDGAGALGAGAPNDCG